MIPSIIALILAFAWLLYETDFMRVRLPIGNTTYKTLPEPITEVQHNPIDTPYYWKSPELKALCLMLCQNCNSSSRLHSWRTCHKDDERWTAWKLPAKTIKAFDSTLNLAEGCNITRSNLLKDIAHEHKKKTVSVKPCQLPIDAFIEQVRIGSHKQQYGMHGGRRHYEYTDDYKMVFHDCLPGKDWLEAHYKDEYPEATIELSVDGKTLSVSGNYKKGTIQAFMSEYTQKVRAGKKTMTIQKGGHIENCGGGVYTAVNE